MNLYLSLLRKIRVYMYVHLRKSTYVHIDVRKPDITFQQPKKLLLDVLYE